MPLLFTFYSPSIHLLFPFYPPSILLLFSFYCEWLAQRECCDRGMGGVKQLRVFMSARLSARTAVTMLWNHHMRLKEMEQRLPDAVAQTRHDARALATLS